jgi:hypothetical protein
VGLKTFGELSEDSQDGGRGSQALEGKGVWPAFAGREDEGSFRGRRETPRSFQSFWVGVGRAPELGELCCSSHLEMGVG